MDNGAKEVVILLTDMVQYSSLTQDMEPGQIRDFIIVYYEELQNVLGVDEFQPLSIDPSAGDGAIIIFEKRRGGSTEELCTRALQAAIRCNKAIDDGCIPATRMGLFLGDIIEARLGERVHKFGSSFAVASRLEELCGYYDTRILMDREVARKQQNEKEFIVAIGKVTPKNFSTPFNLFSILKPGVGRCPADVDKDKLLQFIAMKNEAMDLFCGNLITRLEPDFPKVREQLTRAQHHYYSFMGYRDLATDRILEYIREFPFPEDDFKYTGIKIGEKRGNELGFRLFHLSKQLLRAIDTDLYTALVANTDWEHAFQLEWRRKDEAIVTIGDSADGIYYIDSGVAHAQDADGEILAVFTEGSIFGEMAYYNKEKKRSATVIARTDVVLRKVSNEDFEKMPVIKSLFYRLAKKRRDEDLPY
ncbi:cyclic nucleotide-binding domain-containing protein [Desulfopila inferna]|uniref:cyclic nucleotide-binding domain-containing protein n=1 Tax=Desulfopila inferna TaxID=468528 RepID=UPI001965BF04|nr:cyclic nucleotide-binding domain-containing protein [Desulfopila inferna]MBM9603320.1 cyclic nucleotide-binding domain-containing protein [Desulfopila inferna]